jgi:hypothetical protein
MPLASAHECPECRSVYGVTDSGSPAAETADVNSRGRKLSRRYTPPDGAGNSSRVSNLAGSSESATAALRGTGTLLRDFAVFVPNALTGRRG